MARLPTLLAVCLAFVYSLLREDLAAPRTDVAIGVAIAGFALLVLGAALVAWARPRKRFPPVGLAALRQLAWALGVGVTAAIVLESTLRPWEASDIQMTLLNAPTALFLDVLDVPSISNDGAVFALARDGYLEFRPFISRLLLRTHLIALLVWVVLTHGRNRRVRWTRTLSVFLSVVWLRYAVVTLVYCHVPNVLERAGPSKLGDYYGSNWATLSSLLLMVVLWRILGARGERAVRRAPRTSLRWAPVSVGLLACAWTLYHADLPGRERAGTVLFDDSHLDYWGRADRRMDENWYGDFSSYNFAAAAEWLGHHYPVSVNRDRELDDSLLRGVSVLVLKTPNRRYSEAERESIRRFVESGGGVLMIGDHTDLHGMNTFLNEVATPFGIEFHFDAVADGATGYFNRYRPRIGVPRPASVAGLQKLEFMTSCSIRGPARPNSLLILPRCTRDPGDYSKNSNFSSFRSDPSLNYGAAALAASATYGRGRVVGFTDSTVFSSFSVFKKGHDDYLLGVIGWLSKTSPPALRRACMIVALACLGFGVVAWIKSPPIVVPVCLAVLLPIATYGVDCYHRAAYAPRAPQPTLQRINILWDGGGCAFPPTLGIVRGAPLDRVFDTLMTNIARTGRWPKVAWRFDDILNGDPAAVFVINPVGAPPRETLDRLVSRVRKGMSLVVVDRYDAYPGYSSAHRYFEAFGSTLELDERSAGTHLRLDRFDPLESAESELTILKRECGDGSVYFVVDSKKWSRVGFGHSFAVPNSARRALLRDLYRLLQDACPLEPHARDSYMIVSR